MKGNIGKLGMLLTVFLQVGSVFVGNVSAAPQKETEKTVAIELPDNIKNIENLQFELINGKYENGRVYLPVKKK